MTVDGAPRQVGVELEFSGIEVAAATRAIADALGGTVGDPTPANCGVEVPELGGFQVELDWDFFKQRSAESVANDEDPTWLEQLGRAAAMVVPVEVVCPPLPAAEIARLDPMVAALRQAGAVGTSESLIAGYGVHLNVEPPALDAATIWSYLRAYCLLQWWLVEAHEVNLTRRISPFVNLYPESYVQHVVSRDEAPSMTVLIDDYLAENATRNRALDMLPLFMVIDEDRVIRAVEDEKLAARPTFHYRLPNCNIEDPDWSLANSWNIWTVVEECAARPALMAELSRAFVDDDLPVLGVLRNDWIERVERCLSAHKLA